MKRKLLLASMLCLGGAACTNQFLQKPVTDGTNLDDRLTISGRVCTARPDPSGFPVKVVFIVDQSGSMCVSDPPGSQGSPGFCEMYAVVPPGITQPGRVRALNRLLDQFSGQPNVQVALVPFETNVKGQWPGSVGANQSRFGDPNDSTLRGRVNNLQNTLGKGTDYQGALAYTYGLIASDIDQVTKTSPEVLPRTKYVVVFLTDGTPFPRCSANNNLTQFADDLHPELTWADSYGAGNFCDTMDPEGPDAITGFVAGTDRNQNYQLFSYVDQLMSLKDTYNIGDIRMNTVLLFNQQAVTACGPICQDLYGQYVRWPGPVPVPDGPAAAKSIAKWLLQQMADKGNGIFQEFNDFGGIGNLSLGAIDFSTLASKYVMKTLFVQPMSSTPGVDRRLVDTDGDGVPDDDGVAADSDQLFSNRTSPYNPDSDGDGFDDAFELRHHDDGFRADQKDGRGCDPASPLTQGCVPRDTDGDGLSSYAEDYLGTRPTLVDSDGDGIPDGIEARFGLDPLTPQRGLDTDGDGVSDVMEIRLGSSPIKPDKAYRDAYSFQYDVTAVEQADHSFCYDFSVSNIPLVTTPLHAGWAQEGFNLFKVWFAEAPEGGTGTDYGQWKVACAWAQFAPPQRVPAGPGVTPLTNDRFRSPFALSNAQALDSTSGPCVGIPPSAVQP